MVGVGLDTWLNAACCGFMVEARERKATMVQSYVYNIEVAGGMYSYATSSGAPCDYLADRRSY